MKKYILLLLLVHISIVISCVNQQDTKTIKVAASPVPHAVILEQAIPLLQKKGYTLKIEVINDYVTPNVALTSKSIDANYFQHLPYLNQFNLDHRSSIIAVGNVHLEPIGIYSKRLTRSVPLLDQLHDGDVIIMSNSVSDQGRLLFLLQDAGILTLQPYANTVTATLDDIETFHVQVVIRNDVAPEFLSKAYSNDEAALILINSNFALDTGLHPLKDAILLEATTNNPYANIIATLANNHDDPKIIALTEVLQSEEIKQFIIKTYNGAIIPAANE
ncbi:MetQ/NlpA family ABC transporter substrate-binding protein [Entomospira nematocerorum]|uniref:Methionine ABC transporter substrate-binding protein n=1 Tax=Entomospira nematocerorum TaxID=2719987 RepID=A0A968GB17_9SPIO|nr:MetQ/NlpA family ABC transporter substrate-binding protein [Entomospira nematocera]NIZ46580.1 methionine ABC transporter substrate-binding protein [Entomospira nematocera]WDI33622.1 MetQ/NlpA family ABC transporter substrate-binding protein [Entomospira nematocera]